jgi:hypothetical protein
LNEETLLIRENDPCNTPQTAFKNSCDEPKVDDEDHETMKKLYNPTFSPHKTSNTNNDVFFFTKEMVGTIINQRIVSIFDTVENMLDAV